MFKNYFKIALRNLWRNKLYSLIHILGLSVALSVGTLILLFVADELSYDSFHENKIYRIDWFTERPQTRTPHPMAQALVRDFPEVKAGVSITPIWGSGLTRQTFLVRYQDKKFEEKELLAVDTSFFDVFSFKTLKGNAAEALRDPNAIIITQKTARKYFGREDALGKLLNFNGNTSLKVAAVLEDIPHNSHFHFDFLISYLRLKKDDNDFFSWGDFGHFNYIALEPNVQAANLEKQLPKWFRKYAQGWSEDDFKLLDKGTLAFKLGPVDKIHLHSHLLWELEPNSYIGHIYIFSTAAILIILIALVNSMNLNTAFALERVRQVGIRKLVGAKSLQIFIQFFIESLLMVGIALLTSICIFELILNRFNQFTLKNLSLQNLGDIYSISMILFLVVLFAVFMAAYPAWFINSYQPIDALKKKLKTGKKGVFFRESLVVFQFIISIGLIICTFVVNSQIQYLKNRNLGFEPQQTLIVPIKSKKMRESEESFKEELQKNPAFVQISAVSNVPFGQFNQQDMRALSTDKYKTASLMDVDYDFFKTLKISLLKGRTFERSFVKDQEHNTFVLNETAARMFEWKDPLNEVLTIYEDGGELRGTVVGVVKDFNFQSLHEKITPMVFRYRPETSNHFLIKLHTDQLNQSIAHLENTWKAYDKQNLFEYRFLDESMAHKYQAEVKMGQLFGVFSGIAILIACLGLFGLASFLVVKRTKEIGIRKVLGATIAQIIYLISRSFLRLVLIACLLAVPIAYYVMYTWLQDFAYRVEISWWIFIVSGLIALLIAFLTIAYHALRASLTNPVETLRYE